MFEQQDGSNLRASTGATDNRGVVQFVGSLMSIIDGDVVGGPDGRPAGKFLIQCRPTCGREWN